MSCSDIHILLSVYIDDETTPDERAEVERHLETCEHCTEYVRAYRALKDKNRTLSREEKPFASSLDRIETWKANRRASNLQRYLLVAVILLGILTAIHFMSGEDTLQNPEPMLASMSTVDQVAKDHQKMMSKGYQDQIEVQQLASVAPFFSDRVPFTPIAPEIEGAQFKGGKVCSLDGRPVQLMFYERAGQTLSLYVTDNTKAEEGCSKSKDATICAQKHEQHMLWLAGEASQEELEQLLARARW